MADNNRIGAVTWLVLLLGLVTTALGVAYGVATTPSGPATTAIVNTMAAAIVGSLGAGIVGAALSMVITRVIDRARTQDFATVLSRSLTARFISSSEELDAIRGDWHHYHLTSMDGRSVWRYTRHRLDRSPEINSIQTYVDVTDARGDKHRYNVEAGVRGTKGILLLQRARGGTSSEAVEIFPSLTKAFPHHPLRHRRLRSMGRHQRGWKDRFEPSPHCPCRPNRNGQRNTLRRTRSTLAARLRRTPCHTR
jgi:hypothetical protein